MEIEDRYKYNSVDVAAYIVARANKEKISINMTKLPKLLYIAYGAYLFIHKSRLTNEHPQAWPYGPVFPTTRNHLLKKDFSEISIDEPEIKEMDKDSELQLLVNFVFKGFGSWSAGDLTAWSHQEGSPWYKVSHSEDFRWGTQIPDKFILDYFSNLIKLQ